MEQDSEYHIFAQRMVKLILNSSILRLPIKKSDLVDKCCDAKIKVFPRVFPFTKEYLQKIYGIEIIVIPGSPVKYITISTFSSDLCNYSMEQKSHLGLLLIILSYIYMKGGIVGEKSIIHFLKKFGVEMDEPHPHFGNIKKLIDETFVKQLYLKKTKETQEGMNEDRIIVSWGQRADAEFPKKDILDIVAKIMNKPTFTFKKQYIDLNNEMANTSNAIQDPNEN